MNNIHDFYRLKASGEKITMVTCYDYTSAKQLEKAGVDCVLVGDSAAMVMHGYPDTTHATIEMMVAHISAVARGLKNTFIIGDLPFMSYRRSLSESMAAVYAFMQAGAHCVKLEGAKGNLETIKYIVESGVPVMGHIGLTPQHVFQLGGFKVQGKEKKAADQLIEQAHQCQKAGCFSLVLECVPAAVAKIITEELSIATIGIGAGNATDGQVLVYQDLLGLQLEIKPKFLKHFCQGETVIVDSVKQYISEVKSQQYPSEEFSYEGD